jgi:hypothetical protein
MVISSSWATRIALATMVSLMLANSANAALVTTSYGTSGVPTASVVQPSKQTSGRALLHLQPKGSLLGQVVRL